MSILRKTLTFVALGALLTPAVGMAHHSFSAQYDGNKPVTLRGTITRIMMSNPHGHLWIDVKTPDGKVVNWELEMGAPQQLYRRGMSREDLPIGKEVIARGFLARDGTPNANIVALTLPGGKELSTGSSDGAPELPR